MIQKRFIFLFFICCFSSVAFGQLDNYKKKLREFRYSKYLDSSVFYFQKGLPLALKLKDSNSIFTLHKNMGDAYEHHQQLDKTLRMYAICDQYIPRRDTKLKSFLLNDKAFTYALLHDYDNAAKLTLKSLELAEQNGNQREVAIAMISVAENFSNLNLSAQAEQYFKKGIQQAIVSKEQQFLEYAHRYYAVHLLKENQPNAAIPHLLISLKCAFAQKDSISIAYNYQQFSIYHFQKKQFQKCFEFGKKAEKIWEHRAENRDLSAICAEMGSYYLTLKQFVEAEFYLKKAEKYLVKDLYFNEKLFSTFSALYQQTNQQELAFSYLLKAKNAIEKIRINENRSKLASLQIQFETDKKEIEIQKQKQQNQIALIREAKSRSQLMILLVFFGFLIVAVGFAIFYLNKIKIKNQLLYESNLTLEKLASQKKILLQEVHHRVKNNLTTLKSLFYLQSRSSENMALKAVLKECEHRIDSMALIHQSLYENGESDNVDFQSFIDNLFDSLDNTYKNENYDIKVVANLENVVIKLSKGIYIGLMLNELATNSYKYAFENQRQGIISFNIQTQNKVMKIVYSDNGSGIDDFETQQKGFGLKLIGIMVKQLNGKMKYRFENGLSQFIITIDGDR